MLRWFDDYLELWNGRVLSPKLKIRQSRVFHDEGRLPCATDPQDCGSLRYACYSKNTSTSSLWGWRLHGIGDPCRHQHRNRPPKRVSKPQGELENIEDSLSDRRDMKVEADVRFA